MRPIRTLALLVAVLSLVVAASAVRADDNANANGKKHKGHQAHGVVLSVDTGKDATTGTIKIKVSQHHKKKGADATAAPAETAPVEKTFTVNADTKFFSVSGKKGAEEKTPATFADVKDGEHLVITFDGDAAKEVSIRPAHQKKEKKSAA